MAELMHVQQPMYGRHKFNVGSTAGPASFPPALNGVCTLGQFRALYPVFLRLFHNDAIAAAKPIAGSKYSNDDRVRVDARSRTSLPHRMGHAIDLILDLVQRVGDGMNMLEMVSPVSPSGVKIRYKTASVERPNDTRFHVKGNVMLVPFIAQSLLMSANGAWMSDDVRSDTDAG